MSTPESTAALFATPISPDIVAIEKALNRVSYLSGRARQHERMMALVGADLDRAAVVLLRQIADSRPLRPGELASLLGVEASHVTRQVQQLEKGGYVSRVPDPDDRRAHRIEITPSGQVLVDRIREVSRRGMQVALADWSPQELDQLATLFHRMVDDFLAYSTESDPPLAALLTPSAAGEQPPTTR